MRISEIISEGVEQGVAEGKKSTLDLEFRIHHKDNIINIYAELDGVMVGYAKFNVRDNTLVAGKVSVDPDYRRQGIATAIYDYAKDQGYDIVPSQSQTDLGREFWKDREAKKDMTEGSSNKLTEVFDTVGNGTWSSKLYGAMVEYNFTASNGKTYRLDFLEPAIGPDEMGPYDFHDHMISDKAYETAKFVEFSQVTKKNPQGFTDKRGTGSAAEVFGTVVNAMVEYINKYKPSMFYFQAVEPNRQRLYGAMAKKLIQTLPGWGMKQDGGQIAVFNKRKTADPAKSKTQAVAEDQLDEACWKGYRKDGMKTMFGKKYPNCVKVKKKTNEAQVDRAGNQGVAEGVSLKQKHEDKKRADQNQVRYGKMTQTEFDKKWTRTERPKPTDKKQGVTEGSEIKIPTEDGITMQDIRLMAGEGKLTKKTVLQAIAIIRKQREKQGVAEGSEERWLIKIWDGYSTREIERKGSYEQVANSLVGLPHSHIWSIEPIGQPVAEAGLNEAKRKRKKTKSKRSSSSANRSPVPRFYGAWGFGGESEMDGGE